MDEATILVDLKGDKDKAFDLLFDLMIKDVTFFVLNLVKKEVEPRAVAEDIASKALSSIWALGIEKFETYKEVRQYVFTTARNAAIDYIRAGKSHKRHHAAIQYLSDTEESNLAEEAERSRYRTEMVSRIKQEIEKLPDQCREAFTRVYLYNLPTAQVAQEMGISAKTVRNHCSIAINKLQQIFSKKELYMLLIILSTLDK